MPGICKTACMTSRARRTVPSVPFADRLTPVLPASDPLGRSAALWAGVLTERAGEPIPYAFALAVARQCPAPVRRSHGGGRRAAGDGARSGATG